MKKKKWMLLIGVCLICALLLCGCKRGSVPEGFDESEVQQKAEEIVSLMSEQDFEGVASQFSDEMAAKLSADDMEENVGEQIAALGAFKKISSSAFAGGSLETGDNFATAVMVCKYENGKAIYTISIDLDGKICGLYVSAGN